MTADRNTGAERLCRRYVAAMEAGDLPGLLDLFADDATAISPISGSQSVRDFYSYVFRVTSDRKMKLKAVLIGSDGRTAAVHVAYTRTVVDAEPATIDGVDVFDLTEDGEQFAAVTVIYDTAPVRADFDQPEARR